MDWGIPLGRRFRALKLWFVLRNYGARRLREMIAEHIALAANSPAGSTSTRLGTAGAGALEHGVFPLETRRAG